jgi:hypothetical protein
MMLRGSFVYTKTERHVTVKNKFIFFHRGRIGTTSERCMNPMEKRRDNSKRKSEERPRHAKSIIIGCMSIGANACKKLGSVLG